MITPEQQKYIVDSDDNAGTPPSQGMIFPILTDRMPDFRNVMGRKDKKMMIELQIPESVGQAIRLPEYRMKQELLTELAVALYSRGIVSFGKARELAGTGKYEFGRMLEERSVSRHYGREELEDDLAYACGQ